MKTLALHELQGLPTDVAPAEWDAMSPARLVGMKHFFLRAFMEGGLDGIRTSLLLARDEDGRLLGAAAFSRIRLEFDCIAPAPVQRVCRAARSVWPGFLMLDLLMFGLPASMADQETVLRPELPAAVKQAVRAALVERSLELLELEGRSACIWKEFDAPAAADWADVLQADKFHWFASLPVALQQVTWSSAAEYAASLRSGYRRQLARSEQRATAAGLRLETDLDFLPHVDEFYPLYMQVLDRSATRLETLTPAFFRGLAADARVRYIRATIGGLAAGGALCYVDVPHVLVFLYVGMDYSLMREAGVYFNLLKAIVDLAAAKGVRDIRWGQTSPDAKGRMGAEACPLRFAIRFRRPLLHRAVGAAGGLLFPERTQLARKVFK